MTEDLKTIGLDYYPILVKCEDIGRDKNIRRDNYGEKADGLNANK